MIMPDERPLLRVSEMTKIYPPALVALHEVSLTLHAGEVVALLGANGAGKSTLAKILTGVESPTSGTLAWEGKNVQIASPAAAKQMGIGIVYQELNLLLNLTAAENVLLGNTGTSLVHHFSRKTARRVYERYAALVPESPKPDTALRSLGVGQRQKVAIIRALSQNPKLLIIDEGTSSWNLAERREFQEVVKHLAHENAIAILYITHFIDDAIAVSDRIVVLRDGMKVYDAEARSRTSYAEIIRAISGDRSIPASIDTPSPANSSSSESKHGVPRLVVENLLTKSTGPLSFQVEVGECVGFYGYPGCGATEVLEAIAGLIPHRGTIRWNNTRLRGSAVHRMRQNVVFCTGDRGRQVVLTWPLYLNVALPRLFRHSMWRLMTKREFLEATATVVERFGVKGEIAARLATLSGGNQQKVIVGSSLELGRPLLLLGDDLTRGIDVVSRAEIHRIMKAILREDVAIVLWSTDPSEIQELCTRVYVFAQGNVVSQLSGGDITTENLESVARTRQQASGVA